MAVAENLLNAEVALLRGEVDLEAFLDRKLRWVHCDQSGLDSIATPRLVASSVAVTSAAGRSAPVLAEHALLFMLAVVYRFRDLNRAQRWRSWGGSNASNLRGLYGKKVLIIGMGHTARILARYCTTLGMSVTAFRRKNCPFDNDEIKIVSAEAGDNLDALLPLADFLVLAASLNDTSHNIIHSKRVELLKPGSYVINVARGALVDEYALARAIRSGAIAGAGLDVAVEEPLPIFHPFWRSSNTYITPHTTPQMPDRTGRSIDIIEENLRRYRSNQPFLNRLLPEDVYTLGKDRRLPAIRFRRFAARSWGRLCRLLH